MFYIFIALALEVLVVSCSHQPPPQKETAIRAQSTTIEGYLETDKYAVSSKEKPPGDYKPAVPVMLNLEGRNRDAAFSRDGRRILFVSADRHLHSNPQAYEFELVSKKVRRLTFDDGVVRHPRYLSSQDRFVYMSTADETKETRNFPKILNLKDRLQVESESLMFSATPAEGPSYELYVRAIKSSLPTRLTKTPGYDGEPFVPGNLKNKFFSISYPQNQKPRILEWSEKTLRPFVMTVSKTPLIFNLITGGIDKQKWWAWLGGDNPKALQIYFADSLGQKPRELLVKPNVIQSMSLHPKENVLLLSAILTQDEQLEIYTYSLADNCLKRLTYDASADFDPVFSPDGKTILFASRRSGKDQLYLMDYQPPGSCTPQN